jgi:hypothetical protein
MIRHQVTMFCRALAYVVASFIQRSASFIQFTTLKLQFGFQHLQIENWYYLHAPQLIRGADPLRRDRWMPSFFMKPGWLS